jgi:hypothetical protein
MAEDLVDAYNTFERNFDGSTMLDVYEKLLPNLRKLAELAQKLSATPTHPGGTLEKKEVEFDVVAPGAEEGKQTVERGKGTGQATGGDLFLGGGVGGSRDSGVGKRKRTESDLEQEVHPAAKEKRFLDR